jgi:hypothetical protein
MHWLGFKITYLSISGKKNLGILPCNIDPSAQEFFSSDAINLIDFEAIDPIYIFSPLVPSYDSVNMEVVINYSATI